MKEITMVRTEKMGFGDFRADSIYFMFDGYEGRFIKTIMPYGMEYDVGYLVAYANWNSSGLVSNTMFGGTCIDLSEFITAFKNKFGIEIPTVKQPQ